MLRIRAEQMNILGRNSADRFVRELVCYLRAEFEEELAAYTEEQLKDLVFKEMGRARTYGIETEAELERYLEFRVSMGPGFDTKNEWIQDILGQRERTGAQKLRQIENQLAFGQPKSQE